MGLSNASGLTSTASSAILQPINPGLAYGGGGTPAEEWADAVIAAGGTVSPAWQTVVDNFITTEIANGTWGLTDDYWVLSAENSQQALISLKGLRPVTAVAAPTFEAGLGYSFNGTTQYLNTGFAPLTHAVAATPNSNIRLAVWQINELTGNFVAFGSQTVTSRALKITPRNGSNMVAAASSTVGTFTLPVASSIGFTSVSRDTVSVTSTVAYKNGVAMVRTVDPTTTGSFPDHPLYFGMNNNAGAIGQPSACQLTFGCVGAALTPAQELAQYNNVNALLALSGAVTDADAQLWATQVVTNGGAAVGATQLSRVSALIARLKAAGTWALADDYWLLVGETSHQALTSLKQLRLSTAVASPVFGASGYTFDGVASYLNTNFSLVSNAVFATLNSARLGVYHSAGLATGGYDAGMRNTSNRFFRIRTKNPSNNTGIGLHCGDAGYALPDSSGLGFFSGSRTDATAATCKAWRNGVPLVRVTDPAGFGANVQVNPVFIGGVNDVTVPGVVSSPLACTVGFMVIGGPLSDAQELAEYNAIQAYMTAWGAAA